MDPFRTPRGRRGDGFFPSRAGPCCRSLGGWWRGVRRWRRTLWGWSFQSALVYIWGESQNVSITVFRDGRRARGDEMPNILGRVRERGGRDARPSACCPQCVCCPTHLCFGLGKTSGSSARASPRPPPHSMARVCGTTKTRARWERERGHGLGYGDAGLLFSLICPRRSFFAGRPRNDPPLHVSRRSGQRT